MAKRGRKRKLGARKPCGRLKQHVSVQPVDYGTDEIQRRRAGLQGETDNPLPKLVARGVVSNEQAEAAERYATDHARLWGPQRAPAARYEQYIPGDGPGQPRDQVQRFNAWQAAHRAVIAHGGGLAGDSILRLVVTEWTDPPPARIPALLLALDALVGHYILRRAA